VFPDFSRGRSGTAGVVCAYLANGVRLADFRPNVKPVQSSVAFPKNGSMPGQPAQRVLDCELVHRRRSAVMRDCESYAAVEPPEKHPFFPVTRAADERQR
jgi:hypothetical protein